MFIRNYLFDIINSFRGKMIKWYIFYIFIIDFDIV